MTAMATFFQIALNDFLMPVLWWSAVFMVAAAGVGAGVTWWLVRRLRGLSAAGIKVSGVRKFLSGLTVGTASVLLPCLIALIHAVPFAVERSLAALIERSAPTASDWLVDLSSEQMASLLRVSVDDTALDMSALSERISTSLAELRTLQRPEPILARVRWLTATQSLGLLERSVADLPVRISWRDLVGTTKTLMRTQVSWLSHDVKTGLEAAATSKMYLAAFWVVVSNTVGMAIVIVLVPGKTRARVLSPDT